MCREYNGWSNYETWVVKLWLDNSFDGWKKEYSNKGSLKELIQELYELEDISNKTNMFNDLLGGALDNVNYREILESH